MKADDFRNLNSAELAGKAKDIEEQLFRLRFQISLGQADGIKKYRALRKDRARLLTVLRQNEAVSATAAAEKGN
ncbi:MAG: 50S ribosomal protein L29 [Bryobacterales bacterium]|nr:50S ribosomal protein L29 [Bryobacterales bacterium]